MTPCTADVEWNIHPQLVESEQTFSCPGDKNILSGGVNFNNNEDWCFVPDTYPSLVNEWTFRILCHKRFGGQRIVGVELYIICADMFPAP